MKLRILKYLALLLAPLGLLLSCEKQPEEPVQPSNMDARTIQYRATVTNGADTRVSLSGLSYRFEAGDRLYVINTDAGDDAGKLYGFMHLVSGAGTGTAVFEGDLVAEDDFVPAADTPLAVTLVGVNDLLHTCANGKVTAVASYTNLFAADLSAVSRYSHFTDTGEFGDRYFTLSQQSAFVCFNLSFESGITSAAVTLKNNDTPLWTKNDVPVENESGSFVAVIGGSNTSLEHVTLEVTPSGSLTPLVFTNFSSVTLAANHYYNIAREAFQAATSSLFTIKAPQATTVTFNYTTGLKYSSDGLNWYSYSGAIEMAANQVLYFRATGTSYRNSSGTTPLFTTDNYKSVFVYGDIMSLMSGADTVPNNAFEGAFQGATWIDIPADQDLTLSATTLGLNCYKNMFNGCTGLTKAPILPATTLANNCYQSMFQGCTSLTGRIFLPAPTLVTSCYQQMFDGASAVNEVICLATDHSASKCTQNWLHNVAGSGTFWKSPDSSWTTSNASAIPSGWTPKDYGIPLFPGNPFDGEIDL